MESRSDSEIAPEYFVPYVMRGTFNECSFEGWASYPMVEDYGYNPAISPRSEPFSGMEVTLLQCQVFSFYPGTIRLGCIKKVSFWINRNSSVRFMYYLRSYEPVKQIRCCFVSKEGRYYDVVLKNPEKDSWQQFIFSLNENLLDDKPTEILSMFITAEVECTYADQNYGLKIFDIEVNALRPLEPTIINPEYLDHSQYDWAFVPRAYLSSDTLNVRVDIPKAAQKMVGGVDFCLLSPDKRSIYESADSYLGKPIEKSIRVFEKGQPGLWRLTISCKDKRGIRRFSKAIDILQV
jgi:hypothetical protein